MQASDSQQSIYNTFLQNNHIGACFDCAYLHNLGKVLLQVRLHGVNFIPQALVSLCTGMHILSLYGLTVSHCNMNAEAACPGGTPLNLG